MTQSTLVRWSNPEVIVVATNLLEGRNFVLHAINQAKLSSAKVLLVHVVPPFAFRSKSHDKTLTIVRAPQVGSVTAKLDQMVDSFHLAGIECEPLVLGGLPGQQIPLLVKSRSVDRVIVANRNVDGVSRLVEGAVAEELIAGLEVPVCNIGRGAQSEGTDGTQLGRILLATSFEPNSALLAGFASTLAELNHSQLTLLHVIDTFGMSEQQRELAKFATRKRLLRLIPKGVRHAQQPVLLAREGDPATIIAKECNSTSQDLLILGSPYPAMLSWLLGTSVVHRVIVESKCPVLTIKQPRRPPADSLNANSAEAPLDDREYA